MFPWHTSLNWVPQIVGKHCWVLTNKHNPQNSRTTLSLLSEFKLLCKKLIIGLGRKTSWRSWRDLGSRYYVSTRNSSAATHGTHLGPRVVYYSCWGNAFRSVTPNLRREGKSWGSNTTRGVTPVVITRETLYIWRLLYISLYTITILSSPLDFVLSPRLENESWRVLLSQSRRGVLVFF